MIKQSGNGPSYSSRQMQTLKSAGIGLFSYSLDGTVQYVDEVVLNQLELRNQYPDPAELTGMKLSDLISEAYPGNFIPEKIHRQKRVRDNQLLIKTLSGNKKWVLHDLDLVFDAEKGEEIIYATLRIINKLKLTEERLRESEGRYRTLIEDSPYGVCLIDTVKKNLVDANPALLELLGMSRDELIGADIEQLFCNSIREYLNRSCDEKSLHERTITLISGYIHPQGKQSLPVEVHDLLVHFEERKYLQLTIRDISEYKRIEEEKIKLIKELINASQRLNRQERLHPQLPAASDGKNGSRTDSNSNHRLKGLSDLLPICSGCKKIRDAEGIWTQVEEYVGANSNASFSHSLCPDCAQSLYPEYLDRKKH